MPHFCTYLLRAGQLGSFLLLVCDGGGKPRNLGLQIGTGQPQRHVRRDVEKSMTQSAFKLPCLVYLISSCMSEPAATLLFGTSHTLTRYWLRCQSDRQINGRSAQWCGVGVAYSLSIDQARWKWPTSQAQRRPQTHQGLKTR